MLFQMLFLVCLAAISLVVILSILCLANPAYRTKFSGFMIVYGLFALTFMLVAVGLFIGFMISFSACYKQYCNFIESSAMMWAPGIGLVGGIVLSVYAKRNYNSLKRALIENSYPYIIVIVLALTLPTYYFMGYVAY